ncbi:MAG: PmoA family protein [Planctomycetes bacterium]|nr:PmoA family protein [Planctomycetota bacterium]
MLATLLDSSPERRTATFKVFHHVYSPDGKTLLTDWDAKQLADFALRNEAGKTLLTDWDAKQLFPHHRGIFYGFSRVTYDGKQADIWHCTKGTHQLFKKSEALEACPDKAREKMEIAWNGNDGKTFATEHRELTVYKKPGGTMIDFVSTLVPTHGTVKLDGDPQHAGFHFRAAKEVAASTKGETYYLRPDGKGEPGKFRNWNQNKPESAESKQSINIPWKALSMVVAGKRYTVLYMDHPANPKPARHSERDYGRFGSYFVAEATPEKPLTVRYRLWIQDGEMTVGQAAAKAAEFVEPMKATAK